MTRKEQANLTKQRITATALNLASAKKFSDIKVNDICAAAGVSVGSFYHYFTSKEDVFLSTSEIFDTWTERRLQSRTYKDYRDKLEALIGDFFLNAVISTPQGLSSQYALRLLAEDMQFPQHPYFVQTIEECLKDGIKSGEFSSDYEINEMARMMVFLMRGIVFDWAYERGSFDVIAEGKKNMDRLLQFYLK